jgi:BirA family transcriptional regulator, biotin operon repressor / biotin---[acetyl-CoA-carboxylase] ligase
VAMPISRAVRMTRTAISPRLAIRIFFSMGSLVLAGGRASLVVVSTDAANLTAILAGSAGQHEPVAAEPGWRVEWVETIDSTNRVLAEGLRAGERAGRVLVSDHQSAGRGRLGRTWEAPPRSGLLLSFSFEVDPESVPVGLVPLAVGLAVFEAVTSLGAFGVELKWPNDLMVGERKLCGILCEAVRIDRRPGLGVVCGTGVNRVRPAVVDGVLAERGVWLSELGVTVEPSDLAGAIVIGAARWIRAIQTASSDVVGSYMAHCATIGRSVHVALADGAVDGTATGIDETGALLIDTGPGGRRTITAGDVVHVRPPG